MSSEDDIPIDPSLLNEGPSSQRPRRRAAKSRPRAFLLLSDEDGSESEDEEAEVMQEGIEDESSGLEDGDEDAYVDEAQEDEDEVGEEKEDGGAAASGQRTARGDDTLFNRLAGNVSKAGEAGEIDLSALNIDEEVREADDDLLAKPMTKRQMRRAARKQHKPSYQVERLLGRANVAYTNGDTKLTVSLYAEVIRHDPYVIAAWNTLASVYEEEGNEEGARQMRFFAAHVEDEGGTWKDLARQFRQNGKIDQCIYCLRKALSREPSDVGVLFELASIYRLTGNAKKMVEAFKKILRTPGPWAHDFSFLQQFRPAMKQTPANRKTITGAYRAAFDWHLARCDPGDAASTMTLQHVISLVDDLTEQEQVEEAVDIIRRGQRWLQGRRHQTMWDTQDGEYDPPQENDEDGVADRDGTDGVDEDIDGDDEDDEDNRGPRIGANKGSRKTKKVYYPLETPLRYRLAVLLLRLGEDYEADIHITELLHLDPVHYQQIFEELGRILVKREQWGRALQCIARINACPQIEDSTEMMYLAAVCMHEEGRLADALEALDYVLQYEPGNTDARYRQIKVYEDMGQKDHALELVQKLIQETAALEGPAKARVPRMKKMTKAERAGDRKLTRTALEGQMREQMQLLWSAAQAAEADIGEGSPTALDAFIQAAGTMVENFRLARNNFTKSRGVSRVMKEQYLTKRGRKNDMASRVQELQDRLERALGVEENDRDFEASQEEKYVVKRMSEFYGLGREEWLQLVVKYCAVLMVKHEADTAMDILEHVVQSALFNTRRCEVALRMTIIACAMRLKRYDTIVDNCKRLAQLHQFHLEPFLLMMSCLSAGGIKAHKAFRDLKLQKFIHRELRIHDALVRGHQATYSERMSRWTEVIKKGVSRRLGDEAFYEDTGPVEGDEEDKDEEDRSGDEADQHEAAEQGIDENDEREESENGDSGIREEAWSIEIPRPTAPIPHYNIVYGLHMLSTKAFQSALFYLLRAYAQVPYDPLVCLSIAQAYFGRCMKRQSDNRNYQIAQGLAFLTKYREYSGKDQKTQEEVEYNYGRSFHGLGVPHLAIEHYERVIQSVETRMAEAGEMYAQEVANDSLVFEAAHNLTLLYSAVGNLAMLSKGKVTTTTTITTSNERYGE